MSDIHTFVRPEAEGDTRKIGDAYIDGLERYDEGARYTYQHGAHDLALFWTSPSPAEITGFRSQPIEVGLYQNGPAAFLLYKIDQVCEWSDVAFNIKRLPEAERQLPDEPTGERARFRLTLVDTGTGIIRAKRLVSLDKVMTQALRHAMREQAAQPFNQTLYDIAVQETYARFPDTDALVRAAELVEATHG